MHYGYWLVKWILKNIEIADVNSIHSTSNIKHCRFHSLDPTASTKI